MRVMRTANVGQESAFLVQFVPLFRFPQKGYELGNIFGRILSFFCQINRSVDKEKTLQITEFVVFGSFLSLTFVAKLWSWRESNPRPNKEMISFLHVYLRFDFRVQARPKPPTCALSFLFHCASKAKHNYLRFIRTS